MDGITKALNLWDIEQRINQIHMELEILHTAKAELLGNEYTHLDYSQRTQSECK